MPVKNFSSPYSKMYLVSPAVYEKLLQCLDEPEKSDVLTSSRNLNLGTDIVKRPSEITLEKMHESEITPSLYPDLGRLVDDDEEMTNIRQSSVARGFEPIQPVVPMPQGSTQTRQRFGVDYIPRDVISTIPESVEPDIPMPQGPMQQPTRKRFGIEYVQPTQVEIDPSTLPLPDDSPRSFPLVTTRFKPNCVMTNRGKVCSIGSRGRTVIQTSDKTCGICGTFFSRKSNLVRHLRDVHKRNPSATMDQWDENVQQRERSPQPDLISSRTRSRFEEPMDAESRIKSATKRTGSTARFKTLHPDKVLKITKKDFDKWKK